MTKAKILLLDANPSARTLIKFKSQLQKLSSVEKVADLNAVSKGNPPGGSMMEKIRTFMQANGSVVMVTCSSETAEYFRTGQGCLILQNTDHNELANELLANQATLLVVKYASDQEIAPEVFQGLPLHESITKEGLKNLDNSLRAIANR